MKKIIVLQRIIAVECLRKLTRMINQPNICADPHPDFFNRIVSLADAKSA